MAGRWRGLNLRYCLSRVKNRGYGLGNELLPWARAFLASQVFALQELVAQGIYLRHNPHSSLFYVVTVVHGFHLLGGMGALCYLMIRASNYPPVVIFDYRRQRSRFAVSSLYWHFLTAIWLGIFLCLLLWP